MSNLGERKKKMMEDAHVCMCRACIYRCVHARLQGVGNKTINPVTSAENENQCSTAFTWWCQPRGPWWHSRWRPLTQVTNHRTHCTASRGVGSPPPPPSPGRTVQKAASPASSALPYTLHSQNMMLWVSRHDWILGCSSFGVLWIKLQWKFLYKAFFG